MHLQTNGVVMKFKGLTALDGVDIDISKGEIVGLIGPNGSGKTTLLNVISGVFVPNSGRFRMGDREWSSVSLREAACLGIRRTFQNIRLFPSFTVLETVEVAAAWLDRGDRRENALRALDELNFRQHCGRIASELSYGMQRRLEIARAIAGKLEFLLIDEPTAGLNHAESQELVEVIQAIRERRGCGIVLIDHDLHVIMNVCDRVIVLAEGKVIACGTPQEVRRDPLVINAYLGS
ncbi:ABC transporter ATP-binding protein [Pseudaminobacter sp. NGMCC 1.201702]|uniref:ABC transporter ATP-binding protein n=1 Tax=Pseudaminobacter sp. NGMCC 1.201702 TaxID=3391825 RepID=UPI0039EE315D